MEKNTSMAEAAAREFLAAGSDGSLGGMPVEYIVDMADRLSGDTAVLGFGDMPADAVSDEMLYTYFAARSAEDLLSSRARREQQDADYARCAEDAMFMYAGVTPEQAGRMQYDAVNGDPSALLGVREKFYYG